MSSGSADALLPADPGAALREVSAACAAAGAPERTGRQAFPTRCLRERLGPHPRLHSWAAYLPHELVTNIPACFLAAAATAQRGVLEAAVHTEPGATGEERRLTRGEIEAVHEGDEPSCDGGGAEAVRPKTLKKGLSNVSSCSTEDLFRRAPSWPSSSGSEAACTFRAPSKVAGRVWPLAQDPKGCREVQEAFDNAASFEERRALAEELRGHVPKAMRCPHANHVLQKCINTAGPEISQFILDELLSRGGLAAQAARHRYGCRIVQQLLKHCTSSQTRELAEMLLLDAVVFACHPFGNYVMQHLMQYGTEDQRHRLIRVIEKNAQIIGRSSSGCGVVAAAMMYGSPEDTVWLARAVLQEHGLLRALAHARHGNTAALLVLEVLSGSERQQAQSQLLEDPEALRSSRYGRVVAESIEPAMACGLRDGTGTQ